ncbi:MAG: hydrogenase expression/formation protein HypE [Candidatus Aureabacteria bacterium]|nr:hydrogenase expression/formation protein HypE [Candidatus Auribacterota bacterium]
MSEIKDIIPSCPLPISDYPSVLLAHGSGGVLMNQLIEKVFLSAFKNEHLDSQHDGAVFEVGGMHFAMTTDSYVVKPIFFPGGDIGSLAVHGTVNDLAMCGARPLFITAGFILEEGTKMETLWKVVNSMQIAADKAGVKIITGDTKVVDKGSGDGIFINTSGFGIVEGCLKIAPDSVEIGDIVILSGDIGRHGIAIMAVREGLVFETKIESDSASVADLVMSLLKADIKIHCMRDLTRGGLASALVEIAKKGKVHISIEENSIPVREDVKGACEILGFDPLYVANEGRFICFVKNDEKEKVLEIMRSNELGKGASIIGEVTNKKPGTVTMKSVIGTTRIVDMLTGEQLPRIC